MILRGIEETPHVGIEGGDSDFVLRAYWILALSEYANLC